MTPLWLAEIELIVLIQRLPAWLEPVMEFLSFFAREEFFLLLLPILYWCVNPRLGVRVGIALMLSGGINAIAKLAVHAPRPYWIGPEVKVLSTEASFGMPSGHAQVSVGVWGVMVSGLRSKAAWWAAGVLAILVSFSRLYLGVHFISDVVAGLLIGLVFLLLFLRFEDRLTAWWQRQRLSSQLLLAAVISAGMLGITVFLEMVYSGWTAPQAWAHLSEVKPDSIDSLVGISGSLFGLLAGGSVMWRLGWFDTAGPLWMKVVRWLVGGIGIGIIYYGLKQVFPEGETLIPSILRYVRYALLTLWVQLGAPLLFLRIGLLKPTR